MGSRPDWGLVERRKEFGAMAAQKSLELSLHGLGKTENDFTYACPLLENLKGIFKE